MKVLGIETSCDETGVALYETGKGLLGHALHSQAAEHARYGGVVPELASRDHIRRLAPLLMTVLEEAGCERTALEGVAYTRGPGLMGALLAGAAFARSLAWGLGLPCLGVHHMEGHLLAPLLEPDPPSLPFVALLVSGGHTQLVAVAGIGRYRVLGTSLDDAVGEAFDKTAKLLGLGYPGGPALERLAAEGDPHRFHFPRPMVNRPGLDFSFSGLKTHAMTTLAEAGSDAQTRADIARAFLDAVVDTLVIKCRRALRQTGIRTLVAAGGVSANQALRQALTGMTASAGGRVFFPRPEFCTDNGAMIAHVGALRLEAGQRDDLDFGTLPRWPLEQLPAV